MKSNLNKIDWQTLYQYAGQWVNFYKGEIISHHEDIKIANEQAEKILKNKKYSGMYVKPEWGKKICLPIYFKTVDIHPWKPMFEIEIGKNKKDFIKRAMLVDSGADISVISKDFGELLGLSVSDNEKIFSANGVGGGILQYVEREIFFKINNKTITKVPVAWIQDDRYKEMIIGREVVFDTFDIEFKQAEETIIFKKR
jgi:Aspartyl protease